MSAPTPDPTSPGTDVSWWQDPVRIANEIQRCKTFAAIGSTITAAMPTVVAALRDNARLHSDLTAAREERDRLREQHHIADIMGEVGFDRMMQAAEDRDAAQAEASALRERVEKLEEALKAAARLVETFPEKILALYSRGPNSPPGNGYRATTRADLAFAVRALSSSDPEKQNG